MCVTNKYHFLKIYISCLSCCRFSCCTGPGRSFGLLWPCNITILPEQLLHKTIPLCIPWMTHSNGGPTDFSCEITGELGAWSNFGNCHVLCFVSSSKELLVDRTELINAIVNGINFYFYSSHVSMALGQIKVKSLPCTVSNISEFETVTTEPTTVTAADGILVECNHKKKKEILQAPFYLRYRFRCSLYVLVSIPWFWKKPR